MLGRPMHRCLWLRSHSRMPAAPRCVSNEHQVRATTSADTWGRPHARSRSTNQVSTRSALRATQTTSPLQLGVTQQATTTTNVSLHSSRLLGDWCSAEGSLCSVYAERYVPLAQRRPQPLCSNGGQTMRCSRCGDPHRSHTCLSRKRRNCTHQRRKNRHRSQRIGHHLCGRHPRRQRSKAS
jgi:hypothetical protein